MQVRTRGTVIYPSSIETWDECLTGKIGTNPGYDPLAFAVDECHKRGMELHAWVVAIPLGKVSRMRQAGAKSLLVNKPSVCKAAGQELFHIPGNPETAEYIASLCREIASNYDVDGISLDYIRYPEAVYKFSDDNLYSKSSGQTRAEWKRANIDRIVRRVSEEVKSIKPWIWLSSSPVGKYGDLKRYPSGGWNCYTGVYQDPKLWLREGWQDMLMPMMYFRGNNFYPFLCDWAETSGGKPVAAGLGIYFLDPREGNWRLNDVRQELYAVRFTNPGGVAFFRSDFLVSDHQGIYKTVKNEFFRYKALTPRMSWGIDTLAPGVPRNLHVENRVLSWDPVKDNSTDVKYVVYGWYDKHRDVERAQTEVASAIIEVRVDDCKFSLPDATLKYNMFAVTAVDRFGNESEPAVLSADVTCANLPGVYSALPMLFADEYGNVAVEKMKKDNGIVVRNSTGAIVKKMSSVRRFNVSGLKRGEYRIDISGKKVMRSYRLIVD